MNERGIVSKNARAGPGTQRAAGIPYDDDATVQRGPKDERVCHAILGGRLVDVPTPPPPSHCRSRRRRRRRNGSLPSAFESFVCARSRLPLVVRSLRELPAFSFRRVVIVFYLKIVRYNIVCFIDVTCGIVVLYSLNFYVRDILCFLLPVLAKGFPIMGLSKKMEWLKWIKKYSGKSNHTSYLL